jgi:hypothetical protein
MFKGWNLTRFLTLLAGGLVAGASAIPVLAPAAPYLVPVGVGLIGTAIKAPGTVTRADLAAHGETVAAAVTSRVVAAVTAPGPKDAKTLGIVAATAAASALANLQPPPRA